MLYTSDKNVKETKKIAEVKERRVHCRNKNLQF